MTKQYRTKKDHYKVDLITTTAHAPRPVVYQYYSPNYDEWEVEATYELSDPLCTIEEVPQEPLKIGDTWESDGETCVLATILPDGSWGVYCYAVDSGHLILRATNGSEWAVRREIQEYKERNK